MTDKKMNKCMLMLAMILVMLCSCQTEEVLSPSLPEIRFDAEDGIYHTKVNQEFLLTPETAHDQEADYSWKNAEGELLGNEKTLRHTFAESGEYYLSFSVTNSCGTVTEEILVIVSPLLLPEIHLDLPEDKILIAAQGEKLELTPEADGNSEASWEWFIDGKPAGKEQRLDFPTAKTGSYSVRLTLTNGDGSASIEFTVKVRSKSDLPFSWTFKDEYHVSLGRTLHIRPLTIENAGDAEYTWTLNGQEVQKGPRPDYAFKAEKEGKYQLSLTLTDEYREVTKAIEVTVCPAEGTYRRAVNTGSQAEINKVFEYTPAPGQFINEGMDGINTPEAAATYALEQLRNERFVSLGGFGGYIVLGFDHSVANDGGYDLQIGGNSFDGSSEPGIVYVMQDENGNGQPDDNWYELKGSEYGKEETRQNYAVTYTRPSGAGSDVPWSDNYGSRGVIAHNQFHAQAYYPAWIRNGSYTLTGTCLESRAEQIGGIWNLHHFDWGYSDNFSPEDRLEDQVKGNFNHFRISDAVTPDGKPADLQYIDFVKIQTGVNVQAGNIGEASTEVFMTRDYNIINQ